MKKISKTVVFFGNERLATGVTTEATVLRRLIKNGYKVAAVIVNQDEYKSRKIRQLEVETVAQQAKIKLLTPHKLSEIIEELQGLDAQIGILVAYGKIIPGSVIDIFPSGIINIHPSLLPHGRGPTPIEQAILDGAKETGVSIMQLAQDMDAGPIYGQAKLKLSGYESKQQLADSLLKMGNDLLINYLPEIISGIKTPIPQDNKLATYNDLIDRSQSKIDWHKPALQIEREIRAYKNWPKSWTKLKGHQLIIIEASILKDVKLPPGELKLVDDSRLFVGCSGGALEIKRIQPLNKGEASVKSYLAGNRHFLKTWLNLEERGKVTKVHFSSQSTTGIRQQEAEDLFQ